MLMCWDRWQAWGKALVKLSNYLTLILEVWLSGGSLRADGYGLWKDTEWRSDAPQWNCPVLQRAVESGSQLRLPRQGRVQAESATRAFYEC